MTNETGKIEIWFDPATRRTKILLNSVPIQSMVRSVDISLEAAEQPLVVLSLVPSKVELNAESQIVVNGVIAPAILLKQLYFLLHARYASLPISAQEQTH